MDIEIENHGSIMLFRPLTEAGKEWIAEHTPDDSMHFGDALVVEPRYASDLASGMMADGLEVN